MRPAFSVLFLTTLIGAGQGLFLALVTGQFYWVIGAEAVRESGAFYAGGAAVALVFLGVGLFASFFHLARPMRGWRAISQWRTSWLSREVILLPAVMGLVFIYGFLHLLGLDLVLVTFSNGKSMDITLAAGFVGAAATVLLFVCTGMIYACVKFIREWASHWTVINFTLMGLASGFTLAAAYAAMTLSELRGFFTVSALVLTLVALAGRAYTFWRNQRLGAPSTLRSAIGIHHGQIRQVTQGFMGGSFNTKEFFHPGGPDLPRRLVPPVLAAGFVVPAALLAIGWHGPDALLYAAFAVQYLGLFGERWLFFAQGNHVQNLYYQRAA